MNPLNVFGHGYSSIRYISNWGRNIRLFFRQFKWAYQRITRGFCDFDVWDFDYYLTSVMAQGIKHLADTTHSYPGNNEFPTYESWKDYLYEITNKLNFSLRDDLPNEYEEEWLKGWEKNGLDSINNRTPEEEEISRKYLEIEQKNDVLRNQALSEALDMIVHVYSALWD